ncbi:MAG: adenylate kinase, partial [Corynebacterium humireducens]|nr:adenylate kinase [Corynebacterium humireducens]
IRTRLGVYRDETAPLIEHYGDQIISIEAEGEVEEINDRAMAALGK